MRGKRPEGPKGSHQSFGLQVLDNLFRHRFLFVLPLFIFTAVGISQATSAEPAYESTAVVRIGANQNVSRQPVRGANFQFRESAAEGTIRLIGEQFKTRQFATNVAERAGLGDQIGTGWDVLGFVRSSVEFESEGAALVSITASWSDPSTSLALVEATIDAYAAHLADTATNDAAEAERFYRVVLDEAQGVATALETDFAEYVSALAPLSAGINRNIAETVEIDLRSNRVAQALEITAAAQQRVDAAIAANAFAENSSALVTVDDAQLADGPASTTSLAFKTVIGYLVMGVAISGSALLVTSSAGYAFIAPSELTTMSGVEAVALVAPVKRPSTNARPFWSRRRSRGGADPDEDHTRTLVGAGLGDSRNPLTEHRPSSSTQGRP